MCLLRLLQYARDVSASVPRPIAQPSPLPTVLQIWLVLYRTVVCAVSGGCVGPLTTVNHAGGAFR